MRIKHLDLPADCHGFVFWNEFGRKCKIVCYLSSPMYVAAEEEKTLLGRPLHMCKAMFDDECEALRFAREHVAEEIAILSRSRDRIEARLAELEDNT